MKTVGLRPFVVDDIAAVSRADAVSSSSPPGGESLEARERLDARLARWAKERERFEESQRRERRPAPPPASDPDTAP